MNTTMTTAEMENTLSDTDWQNIRHGSFPFGTDEFRVSCGNLQETRKLLNKIGGRFSWNETIGDYVGISKGHPLWNTICEMKS